MSDLPRVVQRAPAFFYAAAVLFFIASIVLLHLQLENSMGAGRADPALEPYTRLAVLSGWLQAAEGAIYIAANGLLIRILLAIWSNVRGTLRSGVDE